MAEVGNVESYFPDPWADQHKRDNPGEVDKDMFLQLLVTQMRHQDPLSEQQDTGDFITQMTMFTLVEQITSMQNILEMQAMMNDRNQALHYLNREVEVADEATGETVKGEVTAVSFDGLLALVTVNGEKYPLGNVVKIGGIVDED